MFSSLRSRLWLSYAALIVTALAVVAVVLILFLLRNPLLYRQTADRLRAAESVLLSVPPPWTAERIRSVAQAFDVRILIYAPGGGLLQDSDSTALALSLPARLPKQRTLSTLRDFQGRAWLYSLDLLPDGGWMMLATPRPRAQLLAILTDELLPPLLEGGLIALLLSLFLAFAIAQWIADPLQQVIAAAKTVPSDAIRPVAERGPYEVRELTRAFNGMVVRMLSSQKSQRDFVTNVSHELKTPLTSIQGFAQAILDGTADTPEAREQAAAVIHEEAGRMHRLALDLLDLARLDAGIAEMKLSAVDMNALLLNVAEKFKPLAADAGVELKFKIAKDLPVLTGDGDRLAQVFTNLVENAIKFTPRDGTVSLRAVKDRGEVQVSISDTGAGIPPEAIPHIFDRFYQADSARAGGDRHGAGLGLAIVREIVTAHGGRISVRSAEGRGTAFIVHLPLT